MNKEIIIKGNDFHVKQEEKINKYINEIGKLLVDRNLNDIDLENDDEQFGALLMIGHLRSKIYPILNKIRQEKK